MIRISARWRAALAAKGALLGTMALAFAALAGVGLFRAELGIPRRLFLVALGYLAVFLGRAAGLALADAVLGEAARDSGAEPLASRRAGWSIRTADGRFVEYILWNPWGALEKGRRYTVTYGRKSRVLVEPPQLEP